MLVVGVLGLLPRTGHIRESPRKPLKSSIDTAAASPLAARNANATAALRPDDTTVGMFPWRQLSYALASDQAYREADIAIDFCEDVVSLSAGEAQRIKQLMEAAGLNAKISSIHVNGWFGAYDKLSTTKLFMREIFNINLDEHKSEFAFIGDSPNDSPMFSYFPYSVGVANVSDFATGMMQLPAYVTDRRRGEGFIELADALLG